MTIPDLDLFILKAITTNTVHGLEFAYTYDYKLFCKEAQYFAKLILGYIKSYRALPTRRVLLARYNGHEETTKVISGIWDMMDSTDYNVSEYPYDLEQLKKRYAAEQAISINSMMKDDIKNDPFGAIRKMALTVNDVNAVQRGRSFKHKTVRSHLDQFQEQYVAKSEDGAVSNAILTRYSGIDFATDGLAPSEMLLIGGETNSGKSIWLSNMGRQMWQQGNAIDTPPDKYEQGYNVLFFSLEMPYEECFARFLASLANVPQKAVLNATLTPDQAKRVGIARDFIKNYPYEFDIVDVPRGLTVQEMELRYNDALLTYKPDVVVVDYLGLMHDTSGSKEQDWLKMGTIAGQLHEFARSFDVVMLSAVQLTDLKRQNKGADTEEDKRIGIHRIGRSSLIMHHANVAIQIETRPNEKAHPNLRYHIIKNRKGPLVDGANLAKNFTNGALFDILYMTENGNLNPDDISQRIAEIYRKVRNE